MKCVGGKKVLGKKDVEEFFHSESERLESEWKARAKEKGYAEFFTAPVGETKMTVKHQKPRPLKRNMENEKFSEYQ